MCVIQNMKNGAKSFLIYPGKQKIYPEKLNIDPGNVLPAAWSPLLMQLWHRAISLLPQHTKDLFLKSAASAGTDCSVPGNAKLLCGSQTSLHLLPCQDPSWLMLFFALLFFAVFPQQVCFKHHHPEANSCKRTQYTLLPLSFMGCCLQGHSFNKHWANLQSLYLCFALFNFMLLG